MRKCGVHLPLPLHWQNTGRCWPWPGSELVLQGRCWSKPVLVKGHKGAPSVRRRVGSGKAWVSVLVLPFPSPHWAWLCSLPELGGAFKESQFSSNIEHSGTRIALCNLCGKFRAIVIKERSEGISLLSNSKWFLVFSEVLSACCSDPNSCNSLMLLNNFYFPAVFVIKGSDLNCQPGDFDALP